MCGSTPLLHVKNSSVRKTLDDSNSGFFEFRPHTYTTPVQQFSSTGFQARDFIPEANRDACSCNLSSYHVYDQLVHNSYSGDHGPVLCHDHFLPLIFNIYYLNT
ncbi:hypothetical protein L1987_35452 [Smallanthus sonchifolius]|uniref:Uncharacterized protein n=1 Tax=Smallanthus sonchifolius TaxID=185202 RepID=A0ACB9HZA1_9ASTR|nr:hypothetical protein L1987_35452 [Smallanthus sonchifolius]